MVIDPRWQENQEVYRAAESADTLIPALAAIINTGAWKEFTHPMRGTQRYTRLADYCADFLKIPEPALRGLLDRSNSDSSARIVKALLDDLEPINENGTNQHSEKGGNSVTTPSLDRGSTYTVRRLKRDRPDLAQQVIDGELTANAAAIEAGIRPKLVQVRADDVQAAMRILLKHYTKEQLKAATDEL